MQGYAVAAFAFFHFVLDLGNFPPRMRAPMHSNYQNSPARIANAFPRGPIPSNRPGISARALRDERDFGSLML
jgi:hypothetical protein